MGNRLFKAASLGAAASFSDVIIGVLGRIIPYHPSYWRAWPYSSYTALGDSELAIYSWKVRVFLGVIGGFAAFAALDIGSYSRSPDRRDKPLPDPDPLNPPQKPPSIFDHFPWDYWN